MTPADAIAAVKRLQNWADHEDGAKPSTFAVFLLLTNNFEGAPTFEPNYLGYLEADLLASALAAWASFPNEVNGYLDSECL